MKLYEFFGNINHDDIDSDGHPDTLGKEEEREMAEQVFWFILDDDDLHKEYFLPVVKEMRAKHKADPKSDESDWKLWMHMVKEGCIKFYEEHDVKGHPNDVFNKEFCIDVCKRIADHCHKDILKGEYKI